MCIVKIRRKLFQPMFILFKPAKPAEELLKQVFITFVDLWLFFELLSTTGPDPGGGGTGGSAPPLGPNLCVKN